MPSTIASVSPSTSLAEAPLRLIRCKAECAFFFSPPLMAAPTSPTAFFMRSCSLFILSSLKTCASSLLMVNRTKQCAQLLYDRSSQVGLLVHRIVALVYIRLQCLGRVADDRLSVL